MIHLDRLFWKPGWVETPREEWRATNEALVAEEEWILDGNYGSTMDIRLAAADTVILLDLPRALCLWRILRRRLTRAGRTRPDLPDGCRERVNLGFLQWVWAIYRKRRPGILAALDEVRARGDRAIVLRTRAEVDAFLKGLAPT